MSGIQINATTGDLLISDGTLSIGDVREQNAQLIVISERGEFKEYPTLGVGLSKYVNSTGKEREMLREIKVQLALDGINNPTIEIVEGKLNIEI